MTDIRIEEQYKNYTLIKHLGRGTYGDVYLVKHNSEDEPYAMKVIDLKNRPDQFINQVIEEVKNHSKLKHPNIVVLMDTYFTPNKEQICLILEYADGGDIRQLVKSKNN